MPICLAMSSLIVSPIVSRIVARADGDDHDKLFMTFYRASLTVSMMCPVMSLWGTVIFQDTGVAGFIPAWLTTVAKNLPMAFFWQVLFCGPLVRFIHGHIFTAEE